MNNTIIQLRPELDKICEEKGFEKTLFTPRNIPVGEYGYFAAYKEYCKRKGLPIPTYERKNRYTMVLAIGAKNNAKRYS